MRWSAAQLALSYVRSRRARPSVWVFTDAVVARESRWPMYPRHQRLVLAVAALILVGGIGCGISQGAVDGISRDAFASKISAGGVVSEPCRLLSLRMIKQVFGPDARTYHLASVLHRKPRTGHCTWYGPVAGERVLLSVTRESEPTFARSVALEGLVPVSGVGGVAFAPQSLEGGFITAWYEGYAVGIGGSKVQQARISNLIPVGKELIPLLTLERLATEVLKRL